MTSITSRAASSGNREARKARGGAIVGPTNNAVSAHINRASLQYPPTSTQNEYQCYVEEYLQFVEAVYEDTCKNHRTVQLEWVTNFLVYHAERPMRAAKKGQKYVFDKTEYYKAVMDGVDNVDQVDLSSTEKLKTINSYYAALVNYANNNMSQKIKACGNIKKLLKTIAPRRMVANRASHQEKAKPELDAFTIIGQRKVVEEYCWNKHHVSR